MAFGLAPTRHSLVSISLVALLSLGLMSCGATTVPATLPTSAPMPTSTAQPTNAAQPTAAPTPTSAAQPTAAPAPSPIAGQERTVFVHLFEWRWPDIAEECERFLGPHGFAAIQISPPQEHLVTAGNPWWERYQPVSYRLDSRSGSRAELADMVKRCAAVGVAIYADAVINHMSGMESGTGSAGSTFQHYSYPGLYEEADFHHCGRNGNDDIVNYDDRVEVQTCELLNLADLNTGSAKVQDRIAAYLNDLVDLGVAGFRIDAAKHIDTNELKTIISKLHKTSNGKAPFIYQEVIEGADEPIRRRDYTQNGAVTAFNYGAALGSIFRTGTLAGLQTFATGPDFLPSDQVVVFTDNHDNQRGHGTGGDVLTFQDGQLYHLGNVFMLAWPYGYPELMSSYAFTNSDQGPPAQPDGSTLAIYSNGLPDCGKGRWVCEHRWPDIAGMVGFRNYTAAHSAVSDWWTDNKNAIAFGRGERGYVIINRGDAPINNTFKTSLPAGTYCDVTKGELQAGGKGCSGPTVMVDASGQLTATVAAMSSLAIHGGAKVADT